MKPNLQQLRRNAGFKSAKAFAEHLGMSPATYTAYEQGNRSMSLDQAWMFADVFGCSIDEVAGRDWQAMNSSPPSLSPDESTLIDDFRHCSDETRGNIRDLAQLGAKREAKVVQVDVSKGA